MMKEESDANAKVIITGANSGIGLALAERIAATNTSLVLIDKFDTRMCKVKNAQTITIDLTNSDDLEEAISSIEGKIKAIVNNAGVGFKGKLDDLTPEQIQTTIDVNVRATVMLTRLMAERLKQDGSTILNIASSVAYSPLPGMSIYAASKAFILNWSEALAIEWSTTNKVITFSPSATSTGFQKQAGLAEGSGMMTADQVAEEIEKCLFSGGSFHKLIGNDSKIINAICALLPIRTSAKFWAYLFEKAS